MNIKLSIVLGLVVAGLFPALSLYAWQTGRTNISEEDIAVDVALKFIKNGATYVFDGISGTLRVSEIMIREIYPVQYVVTIAFDSRHAGYGDRIGQALAQVITPHIAVVTVVNNEIVSAVLDNEWDELNQREIVHNGLQPPEFARDVSIKHVLNSNEKLKDVKTPSSWETKDITPEGLVGAASLHYIAEDWSVKVSWNVVRFPIYTVEIEHLGDISFQWKGTVDQDGSIEEMEFTMTK